MPIKNLRDIVLLLKISEKLAFQSFSCERDRFYCKLDIITKYVEWSTFYSFNVCILNNLVYRNLSNKCKYILKLKYENIFL